MSQDPVRKHVVIVGGGPAGLLCAINFLRRNDKAAGVHYTVELVETGEDMGVLDTVGLEKKRSWMIGLTVHGIRALQRVPRLYEDHLKESAVQIVADCTYLGATKFKSAMEDGEQFLADRNYVVAALARYLHANFKDSKDLTLRYKTRVNFVDPDNRQIHVRSDDTTEQYLRYDLLIGCDGVRSGVRAAMVAQHRDFEMSISDTFDRFKAVHIKCPPAVEQDCFHVFSGGVKNMMGFGLPEKGGMLNLGMTYKKDTPCDAAMMSDDAAVVAAYLSKHFKAWPMDFDDFAEKWVKAPWSTTGQVHCNSYHSLKLQALLMGDAAHATSPTIGQGMNTAFSDAAALDMLLDEHKDDLSKVLPAFSEARVKEGNALTWLSFYAFPVNQLQLFGVLLSQIVRDALANMLPGLVAEDPMTRIARGDKLSWAYAELVRYGRIPAVRRVTEAAKLRHFEREIGLAPQTDTASGWKWLALALAAAAAVAVAIVAAR